MRELTLLLSLVTLLGPIEAAHARKSKEKNLLDAAATAVANAFVSAPKDQEACFAPDEPCDVKLAKFIESAKTSLDVAVFDINREQVVHQLLVASRRVPVRIVVDKRQAAGRYSGVETLIKGGVEVRFGKQRGVMHNKYTIVDGKMVQTGSFNYTKHASEANSENQVYLASPEIVARYRKHFETIWDRAVPAMTVRRPAAKHRE